MQKHDVLPGRRKRGITLTDVMFMMMILSVAIIPISGMFPLGRLTIRKAKDLQTALFLAKREINRHRCTYPDDANTPHGGLHTASGELRTVPGSGIPFVYTADPEVIDNTPYTVTTMFYINKARQSKTLVKPDGTPADEPFMVDVAVSVSYPGGGHPILYATRLYKDLQDMQQL